MNRRVTAQANKPHHWTRAQLHAPCTQTVLQYLTSVPLKPPIITINIDDEPRLLERQRHPVRHPSQGGLLLGLASICISQEELNVAPSPDPCGTGKRMGPAGNSMAAPTTTRLCKARMHEYSAVEYG